MVGWFPLHGLGIARWREIGKRGFPISDWRLRIANLECSDMSPLFVIGLVCQPFVQFALIR
jgi:hypothetical protein